MRYLIPLLFATPVLGQSWEYSGPIRGPITPPPHATWREALTVTGHRVLIAEWDEWDAPVAVAARPVARRPIVATAPPPPELVLPMRTVNTVPAWTLPVYAAPSYAVPPRVARAVERTAVPVRYYAPIPAYYGAANCPTGNCR